MWQENGISRNKLYYAVMLSACINIGLFGVILSKLGNINESISSNQIVAAIVTSEEDEIFIKRMCEDLGLESEITVVVGPSYVHSFFSPSHNSRLNKLLAKYPIVVDPADPTRRILMKESAYEKLNTDERRAVIAHEIWHIFAFIQNSHVSRPGIDTEIEANRFATRYISANILIGLYRKYGSGDDRIRLLINDLKRQQ